MRKKKKLKNKRKREGDPVRRGAEKKKDSGRKKPLEWENREKKKVYNIYTEKK